MYINQLSALNLSVIWNLNLDFIYSRIPYSHLAIIISIKMKLTTLANALLLAGTVAAAPGTAIRRGRAARQSKPMNPADGLFALDGPNSSHVQYSGNWAGAVLVGTGYTSVTGTFTVPTPTTDGSGSAWVGIDGDTCGTAILQTGVDWTKSGSKITYDAWYEWLVHTGSHNPPYMLLNPIPRLLDLNLH